MNGMELVAAAGASFDTLPAGEAIQVPQGEGRFAAEAATSIDVIPTHIQVYRENAHAKYYEACRRKAAFSCKIDG